MTANAITAIVNATVIDGTGSQPRPGATVVLGGSTIVELSQTRAFGADVRVIDLEGRTLLPGIIDAHVHMAGFAQWLIANQHQRLMYLGARTARALRATLECGVTTARDQGGLEAGFVQAVEDGLLPGPRLQTSVIIVQPTNGVTDYIPSQGGTTSPQGLSVTMPGMPLPYCNGPWEARAKVREALRAGADFIKIASTSMAVKRAMDWAVPTFTQEEIEAIVDEAHSAGVMVACHAMGGPGLLRAVKAGVDSIEHGTMLDEEAAEEMARRGTWLVPMFWILDFHAKMDKLESEREASRRLLDETGRSLRVARRAGVRIAMGSDAGEHGIGGSMREIQFMVEAGMDPLEALVCSTRRAAECLQMDREIGTIEPGKQADLLVLDGDPLEDIGILQRAERRALVLKDGQPVAGTLLAQGFDAVARSAEPALVGA